MTLEFPLGYEFYQKKCNTMGHGEPFYEATFHYYPAEHIEPSNDW